MNAHRAALLGIAMLIAGCTTPSATPYVTTPLPEQPAECRPAPPDCPPEPQLPKRDITAADIGKDRSAFKRALRCERHQRRTCSARLKALGMK
jgi:hypothetical protein